MSIITRAKNILLTPAAEWGVISMETESPGSLLGKYVLPMSLIPAIATFIGWGVIGVNVGFVRIGSIEWGLTKGITSFVSSILTYYVCTYIVDALAPSFGSEKNIGRSAQLVGYSSTASWVAGIFMILPGLSILSILGLYGIYLFYLGIPVMKKTPEDKHIGYLLVTALVVIVVFIVIAMILTSIVYAIMGNPYALGGLNDMRWR
ncbi:MAG: Yip1 family protein [Bacteroidota bacterium]|nr:Yip1 family protein [Bacteroidota bacterium]MDP4214960.1 Yip1 family protein [Bacteroidota bacterium]MDP4254626.1 Yip1 family protein [Bacteroidota bacterium]MDP4258665.1 Yip1 family protein [Bacteroidota bacterium]